MQRFSPRGRKLAKLRKTPTFGENRLKAIDRREKELTKVTGKQEGGNGDRKRKNRIAKKRRKRKQRK